MDKKCQLYWSNAFEKAHLFSYPTETLIIQRSKPPNGRSIYNDDKEEILWASIKHNYEILIESPKIVSFIRRKKYENKL